MEQEVANITAEEMRQKEARLDGEKAITKKILKQVWHDCDIVWTQAILMSQYLWAWV